MSAYTVLAAEIREQAENYGRVASDEGFAAADAIETLVAEGRLLCVRLREMGYGKTSDTALPGEFDTFFALVREDKQ